SVAIGVELGCFLEAPCKTSFRVILAAAHWRRSWRSRPRDYSNYECCCVVVGAVFAGLGLCSGHWLQHLLPSYPPAFAMKLYHKMGANGRSFGVAPILLLLAIKRLQVSLIDAN